MRIARVFMFLILAAAALPLGVAAAQYPAPAGACAVSGASVEAPANTTISLTVTVTTDQGAPAPGVNGTASITSQPGTGAAVLTPSYTTNAAGQATIQVKTGDTAGTLNIGVTCGTLSASSAVKVTAPGAPTVLPKPPETGSLGASHSGSSFPVAWVILGIAGVALAAGAAGTFALRRR